MILYCTGPLRQDNLFDRVPKEKTWRGNYCCVPLCRNSSGQREERERLGLQKISFHSFPKDDKMKKEWFVKIRRDPGINFTVNKHTKVCSEHFGPNDFVAAIPDFPTARACLQSNAIPSIFPWSTEVYKRKSFTSSKATASFQGCVSDIEPNVSELTMYDISGSTNDEETNDGVLVNMTALDYEGEIERLRLQVKQLQDSLEEARKLATSSLFRLENIKDSDELVKYYTGFSDYITLTVFYEQVLESDAKVMKLWDSRGCSGVVHDVKHGPPRKLPLLEQLFLTLVRRHAEAQEVDLSVRSGLSQSSISCITSTWINLMYHCLKSMY